MPETWGNPWYWLEPYPGPPSTVVDALLLIFAFGLWAGIVAYALSSRRFAGHRYYQTLTANIAVRTAILSGIGILLIAARIFAIPYLSMRAPLALLVAVGVAALLYLAYYMLRRFTIDRAEYERTVQRSRTLPQEREERPPSSGGRRRRRRRR